MVFRRKDAKRILRFAVIVTAIPVGVIVEIGDDVSTIELLAAVAKVPGLKKAAVAFCDSIDEPHNTEARLAAAAEFILEALYVSNRLSKYAYHGRTFFKR